MLLEIYTLSNLRGLERHVEAMRRAASRCESSGPRVDGGGHRKQLETAQTERDDMILCQRCQRNHEKKVNFHRNFSEFLTISHDSSRFVGCQALFSSAAQDADQLPAAVDAVPGWGCGSQASRARAEVKLSKFTFWKRF